MIKFIKFLKKPRAIVILVILLAGVVGSYIYFGGEDSPTYKFTVAEKRDLIQEVSVTGRVKPAESVNLAFERGGKVSRVYANVGDKVGVWQTLVALENSELAAQLLQAEANLESEEAKLSELERGARPEEIQVQEVKVANAKTALEDARRNLVDKLQDAYTKTDDAVRNRVDQFFSNPKSSSPQLSFPGADSQLETDIEWQRLLIENMFKSWRSSLDQLTASSDLASYASEAEINLSQIKSFLDKAALAVNGLTPNANLSQGNIDTWKADVSTGRTNINTAVTNLSTAEEKLGTEKSDLALAEQELLLKKAGTVEEQIASQKAKVKSAQANVQNIQAQIAKTIVHSPINGIITLQDAKVGEIISANTIVVSLISEAKFEIEANVPEADIAKVSAGNASLVTLDAYGRDVVFEAKVAAVDPAETIIDGVATYKVTFQFTKEDERVKSGMTANIDIASDSRENVIAVPQRAIIRKNGDKFVRILNGKDFKEVEVETGLRGSDGNIEIISGVNEGDKVITFSEE